MKSFIAFAFLASVLAYASADCGLSATACKHLADTEQALRDAIATSNEALSGAIVSSAQKSLALYQATINILKTSAKAPAAASQAELESLVERLDALLKKAQAAQSEVLGEAAESFEEASKAIQKLLEETIISVRDANSPVTKEVAFAFGGEGFEALKKQLEAALKVAQGKLQVIVQNALNKLNSGIAKLEGYLAKILGEAGVQKVKELLQIQLDRILKILADKLAKQVAEASKPAFAVAVIETEAFLEELESESKIVKRSASGIWARIQAVASKLEGVVRQAAEKALAKHKPEILKQLKGLGDAIVALGKDLVIEIVNGVVSVTVPTY